MRPITIATYLRYKRCEKGSTLKWFDNENTPVVDVLGDPVLCDGQWNAPGNANQFLLSIATLHEVHDQGGSFRDRCENCYREWQQNSNSTGCRFHPGKIRVWREGNPRKSEVVHNAYSENSKTLKDIHSIRHLYPIRLGRL